MLQDPPCSYCVGTAALLRQPGNVFQKLGAADSVLMSEDIVLRTRLKVTFTAGDTWRVQ